jgi:DNA-binding MarR family transcriptional regulator
MARSAGSLAIVEDDDATAGGDGGVPPFDFRSSPTYAINLLSRLVTVDYLQRIGSTGIAPAQAYVLGELWREEPLSQVELSRRLDIGKATVGQTLARLERSGLVKRTRIEKDRRVVMIALTQKGRDMRAVLDQAAWDQIALLRETLGDEAIDQMTELSKKMADVLKRRNG